MAGGETMLSQGIGRNIEAQLNDIAAKHKSKGLPGTMPTKGPDGNWQIPKAPGAGMGDKHVKFSAQEQAEMDAYGEIIGGGMPPHVGPSVLPPTPPPITKKDLARAERRGWKQGFRTTAFMGSGKAWDPTIERGNGSKIRWFADKPDPAHSYMEGKQQASSNWARNDPSPIEDNANMAPVKLKLGKTLVVNGNGRVWDQLSPKGIKDKAAREALEPYAYNGRLSTDEIARKAQEMGFDSVTFRDIKDYIAGNANVPAHNVYAMINAKNIRGKYAKFENKNRGKLADLLAGGVGAAGVGAALSSQDDKA